MGAINHERKILVVTGCTPIIKDYLEELVDNYPAVFRQSLKKAANDLIREIDKYQDRIFSDSGADKLERAEQLNTISIGFEKWIDENFEK